MDKQMEEKAMAVLADYRTLESALRLARSHAAGDGIPIEPRVTPALRTEEDDVEVLWKLSREGLSEAQCQMVAVLERHLPSTMTYATRKRVYDKARNLAVQSSADKPWVDAFVALLGERCNREEEYLPWTSTESIALRREPWIARARAEVARLEAIDRAVTPVLQMMNDRDPLAYLLLRHQYIEGLPVNEVRRNLGRFAKGNAGMLSEWEHRVLRNRAMDNFIAECRNLSSLVTKSRRTKRGSEGTSSGPNLSDISKN